MRFIKYLILAAIALCLVVMGFANRQPATLTMLPDDLVPFLRFNYSVTLPMYVIAFGGIVLGFVLGEFFEWVREHKHRSEAVNQRRERAQLAAEINKLKKDSNKGKDDVLALIE